MHAAQPLEHIVHTYALPELPGYGTRENTLATQLQLELMEKITAPVRVRPARATRSLRW